MKWLIGGAVVLLAVLAVLCAVVSRSVFEPEYHGRVLSEWLIEFDSSSREKRTEANEAVRQMGNRAVPFLIERLLQRTPLWKVKFTQLLQRQSIIRFRLPRPELAIDQARRHARVFAACDALGPAASGAVPALEEALYKFRDFDAAFAMARVGERASPALMRASTSKDYFVRISALYFLHVLRDGPEMLSVSGSNSDFFRRAGAQERMMLGTWLPKAVTYVPGAGPLETLQR
jgi:hypothetical protein